MNTVWSEHIQGIQTLYLSRKLRFDDMFFQSYEKADKVRFRRTILGQGTDIE